MDSYKFNCVGKLILFKVYIFTIDYLINFIIFNHEFIIEYQKLVARIESRFNSIFKMFQNEIDIGLAQTKMKPK